MDEDKTVALLRNQITAAQESGPTGTDFKAAIDYYYGRPRGDEMPGRSRVQSLDVADMVNAVLAQIVPTFTNDTVCAFEPDAPNDEAQARLETDATNKVMMESSRGFVVFYEAIKDALLLKNGVVKAYLEEKDKNRYLRLVAVDPANFVVGPDTDCILLYDTAFCAERKQYRRGELLDMGFPREKVERIAPGDEGAEGEGLGMRFRDGIPPVQDSAGWANELVIVWECYSQLPDEDDSSKTRLYRCLLGSFVLLLKEPVDYIPYAAGSAFIEPHKFWGLSLYDRLKTVQDAKTAIQRQWLDNLANCNNSRAVVNDSVNQDDYLTGRPGGMVRVRGIGPVSEAIQPLPVIDAGPAAQGYLAYMDQVRADRGGAALQMASGEMQTANGMTNASGIAIDRMFSVQELQAGLMARTLAETLFRSAFQLCHRMLREELREPMMLRLADQWVEVDPAQWRPRVRVNIKAGLSPGERARKAGNLALIVQHQLTLYGQGGDGVLVTLPNLYQSMLDWAAASDIDGPEKYFTDPTSQGAQQAMQAKAQQGQAQAQMVSQLEQMKVQIDQQKLELDKYKHDTELRFKYWEVDKNAEVKEAEIVGGAVAGLELESIRGRNQREAALAGGGNGGRVPGAAA